MIKQLKPGITEMQFGLINNHRVHLFTLTNELGDSVSITNYGATLVSWPVPDTKQCRKNIILGFDSLEEYFKQPYYVGATIGRCANLTRSGVALINGEKFQLTQNFANHHLHGGRVGFDKKIWDTEISDRNIPALNLFYVSENMEEGYPGKLSVCVSYVLSPRKNQLSITYRATCDQPTVVNLTNHSYFNLSGDFSKTIADHSLQIHATHFTEAGEDKLPTGKILPVQDTIYDFRSSRLIGPSLNAGCNLNYVIENGSDEIRKAACLCDGITGRKLEIHTDQPGLQFFTANHFDGTVSARGIRLNRHAALCLEPQNFPDAVNHSAFPENILLPGEEYIHRSVYIADTMLDDSTTRNDLLTV